MCAEIYSKARKLVKGKVNGENEAQQLLYRRTAGNQSTYTMTN